jgi:hypothetical protein
VFRQDVWIKQAGARRDDIGNATALGVDRSPDGLVVIAAAYRDFDSGATHVEVAFVRDLTHMGAAINWLADNTNRRIPIVIDSASPASVAMSRLNAMKKKVIPTHSVECAARALVSLMTLRPGC